MGNEIVDIESSGKEVVVQGTDTGFVESKVQSPLLTKYPFLRVVPILGNELCERLAYYGIATNIVIYLTSFLNESNSDAARNINAWSGTCYVTPLIGAWLADTWLGRYRVIFLFSLLYMVGLAFMSMSAGISSLHPAPGEQPTGGQMGFFWVGMYLIALGTGGIKPCVSTFGADQFNERDPRELALIPRFYNWFYAFINIGAVFSSTVLVYIQTDISWMIGFLIPCCAFVFALSLFLVCTPLYRTKPPGGSPFNRWFFVVRAAIMHRKAVVPDDRSQLHEVPGHMSIVPGQMKLLSTPEFRCLDRAAVPLSAPGKPDRYLRTVTEVEELKCVVRLLPICGVMCVYNAIYAQMSTLFVLQGAAMDCRMGSWSVPPAMINVLDCLSVLFWVPVYDLVLVPFFERRGHPISRLVRIGVGFFIAILAMVAGAVVESIRLGIVHRHGLTDVDPAGQDNVPMSVFWQVPQYFFIGMSEVFAMIGGLEFFYSQSPEAMRSVSSALNLLCTGIGSYLATALVSIIGAITTRGGAPGWIADNLNQGHINYFFLVLAGLMAICLVIYAFLICPNYRYRQVHDVAGQPAALDDDGKMLDAPQLDRLSSRISANRKVARKSFMPVVHGFEVQPTPGDIDDQDLHKM